MKTTQRIFVSSCAFGLTVALAYRLDTGELVGTILLGLFGAAFAFVVGYLATTGRGAQLDGDDDRTPAELAGERIGVFSLESPWPLVLALCSAMLLVGVVLHPWLAAIALAGFLYAIWRLVLESV